MLIEEIKNIKSDKKECRKFGITVGIVLLLIGIILYFYSKLSAPYFIGAGGSLILLGLLVPIVLFPLQKIWMTLAVVLGFVMSRIILTALFYFVVTPIAIIAKLFGKNFIDLKIERKKKSYWNYREEEDYKKITTERQF